MTNPPTSNATQPAWALPPRAARLATELEAWPRRTVTLPELWTMFAAADPASVTRSTGRSDLAAAVAALADAGVLTPSRTLDRSVSPALPTRLTLPAESPTATAAALARRVPWRPELAWASSARLTIGQVGILHAVNSWLRDRGRDDDVIPTRERSLELFGLEKRLDAVLGTSLFAPGRLSLKLLRTFRARPPLSVRRVGKGHVLLVVENSDTFHSLSQALARRVTSVGVVGWGAGAAFEASILSVGDLDGITEVAYFGDVDADGLRIAASAAATAVAEGLPVVRPARALYELLLKVGAPQTGQPPVSDERARTLSRWIGEPFITPVTALLFRGERLPQEAVSARLLAADDTWIAGLRP